MSKKSKLTERIDGGSFTVDPGQFTSDLAKRRHQQTLRKNPRNTVDVQREHFKCTCPWCHVVNVIMSPIDPRVPAVTEPAKGDMIKCDVCRRYHVVTEINLNGNVKTQPVDIPTS